MPFLICGVDEVGRGSLAGPLIAVAAVFNGGEKDGQTFIPMHREVPKSTDIMDHAYPGLNLGYWNTDKSPIEGVDDSKKLSAKKREEVFHRILRSPNFVDFGLGEVSVQEIDNIGIDWANSLAFQRAIADLSHSPNYVLIDGDSRIMTWDHRSQRNAPKGDSMWWPVGAASILAKVIRDSFMAELAVDHPNYGWESNAGYGAPKHIDALTTYGPTPFHRDKFIRNIRRT